MAVERMPITPEVLTWARERAGYKLEELAAKRRDFNRIAEWEGDGPGPTYRQLELLAKDLWLPIAVFFFPEPPAMPPIEETFRTLGSLQFGEIPPNVRLLLYKARAFMNGLSELNQGSNPATRRILREINLADYEQTELAASEIREFLGVSLGEQYGWKDEDTALKAWRSALYRVGVTVFKDAFGVEEYCGFSLFDDEFPIIYINNSNAKTRQIFTLFHELAHLLHRTSGVDKHSEFTNRLAVEHVLIERHCNAVANAILVPYSALDDEIRAEVEPRVEAERIAKRFSVSREVIYRNFLDRGLVIQAEYEAAVRDWAVAAKELALQFSKGRRRGGDYYRTKIRYLGEEYIELAFKRYYQDLIDEEELAGYLAIKPKHLERLEDTLLEGAS